MQAKRQPARTGNKIKETISLAVSGTIELGELFKSFREEAREKEKGKKRRMPVLWVHHHPQQNLASTYPSTQWTTLNQKSPRQHRSSPPVCVRLCPSLSLFPVPVRSSTSTGWKKGNLEIRRTYGRTRGDLLSLSLYITYLSLSLFFSCIHTMYTRVNVWFIQKGKKEKRKGNPSPFPDRGDPHSLFRTIC